MIRNKIARIQWLMWNILIKTWDKNNNEHRFFFLKTCKVFKEQSNYQVLSRYLLHAICYNLVLEKNQGTKLWYSVTKAWFSNNKSHIHIYERYILNALTLRALIHSVVCLLQLHSCIQHVIDFLLNTTETSSAWLATCFTLVSCFVYSSTLKLEATCSSEMSSEFQQTTWHYIPEDRIVHNCCCKNLKSYIDWIMLKTVISFLKITNLYAKQQTIVSTGPRHFMTTAYSSILPSRGSTGRSSKWWPSSVRSSHESNASMI
jgi:hypothetical protein